MVDYGVLTAPPVLLGWAVDSLLGSGDGVHGGHEPFLEPERVVDYLRTTDGHIMDDNARR